MGVDALQVHQRLLQAFSATELLTYGATRDDAVAVRGPVDAVHPLHVFVQGARLLPLAAHEPVDLHLVVVLRNGQLWKYQTCILLSVAFFHVKPQEIVGSPCI